LRMPVRDRAGLLDLDARAGLLELRLDRVGLLAVDALLDRAGRAVDEVLRLLQAQAGDRADDLDHLDLLVACARQDDVERGLLLGAGGAVAAGGRSGPRGRDRDRGGGGDAPLVLDLLLQLDELEDGHLPQVVEHLVNAGSSHYSAPSSSLGCSVAASSVAGSASADASATGSSVTGSAATDSSGAAASSAGSGASGVSTGTGAAASAAGGSPVSPCSFSCSMRASIRPTTAISGEVIAPTTWPRSTSTGGSVARFLTSSSPIGLPSRMPPRIARI